MKYDITTNLTNCTLTPTTVTSTPVTLTLTGNDGATFETAPTISFDDSFEGTVSESFTVSSDKTTATYKLDPPSLDGNIVVTATAKASAPKTFDLTLDVSNCDVTPTKIPIAGTTTITATVTNGYEFKDVPTLSYSDPLGKTTTENFTLNTDKTIATYSLTPSNIDYSNGVTVTAKATKKETVISFDTTNVTNATVTPSSFIKGQSVTITITAQKGYDFSTNLPYIKWFDPLEAPSQANFSLNDDKTIATYTLSESDSSIVNEKDPVYLYATASIISTLSSLYTIYIVTTKDLLTVATKRFGDSGLNVYINDLYRLPLKFNESQKQALYLYNTKVIDSVPIIKERFTSYDLGTFKLPRHYNNANDYNNVYNLSLPYYGTVTLDNTNYMDSDINVKCNVDIVDGSITYLVSRDGQTIDTYTANIKEQLPYLTADTARISYFSNVSTITIAPKVQSYYHDVNNTNVRTNYLYRVSDINGYFAGTLQFINVDKKYYDMINSELNKGVYVNELQ